MMFAARVAALLLVLPVTLSAVTDETPPPPADAMVAEAEVEAPDADDKVVKTKSMLKNLRFAEDWSALADPDVETDHWFPGIKHVEFGEDWTASFGGQVRVRFHDEQNRALTGAVPGHNDFSLLRTRLHGDFRFRDDMRVFVEVLAASIYGNSPVKPLGIDNQHLDLENAFVEIFGELFGKATALRFGRTELQYGKQRLISPLDWANTRRRFEGAVFQIKGENVTTDFFLVHPVGTTARRADESNSSLAFAGVYTTIKIDDKHTMDVFGLILDESDPVLTNGAGMMGNRELYTVGGRYDGKVGSTDYELWAAKQFGDHAGDDINAYAYSARAGQTFGDLPGSPRVGIDFDVASGDPDPTDGEMQTFQQLFPLGHAYFGYLDLVGRQNIISVMPNITVKLGSTAAFRASYSKFTLNDRHDSLYNAGGAGPLVDPAGLSGDSVGSEIDLTLVWAPPCTAPHGKFVFGWSQFKPDRFVETLGDGNRAELLYAQYSFTF